MAVVLRPKNMAPTAPFCTFDQEKTNTIWQPQRPSDVHKAAMAPSPRPMARSLEPPPPTRRGDGSPIEALKRIKTGRDLEPTRWCARVAGRRARLRARPQNGAPALPGYDREGPQSPRA